MAESQENIIEQLSNKEYEAGFVTDIEMDIIPKGLNENTICQLSAKKNEPQWLLDFRLKSYRQWLKMKLPKWANLKFQEPDYQDISYYASPRKVPKYNSLEEVDNLIAWKILILN
jgi:Fe-S cluster assembly protein SufB